MSIPVATALGRKDRLWPAVLASVAVHVALGVVAVARRQPALDVYQTPIVAKLVRLGPKKPEEYLPRKEAAPPPAPAPAAPAAPIAAAPSPKAPQPGRQTAPAPKAAPAAGGSRLASVLDRMQKEVAQSRWGDPNGDPAGDAEEGTEGDRYVALVRSAIKTNYQNYVRVPGSLKAVIVLYLEADGRISTWRFQTKSGNDACDGAIDRAVRRTTRLPPPPPDRRDAFRRVGLGFNFDC